MCPRQYRTGITPDISPWLQFTFWQPILYLDSEDCWPASKERSGFWLGVAENIGDFLTYWILDAQSHQVLARSVVRPFNNNRRVTWDPSLGPSKIPNTAQHGGDIKPSGTQIAEKLRDIEDRYDQLDPEPKPHDIYFDTHTEESTKALKGSCLKDPYLDTTLPHFVPVDLVDPYSGESRFNPSS